MLVLYHLELYLCSAALSRYLLSTTFSLERNALSLHCIPHGDTRVYWMIVLLTILLHVDSIARSSVSCVCLSAGQSALLPQGIPQDKNIGYQRWYWLLVFIIVK